MSNIKLYNTMGREKILFVPQNRSKVTHYHCGPTVWDTPHIGNLRSAISADMIYRLLRVVYGSENVFYARNFTNIDDKIINAAKDKNIPFHELTERLINHYHSIERKLSILPPTFEPKATDHIAEMISMIETLITKDHAYVSNGHVYFNVKTVYAHGLLSGQDSHMRLAGARVEPSENKKNQEDFVLWKPSEEGVPGWESPWGFGRPGWHIECSAMIEKHLGHTIDIHSGGADLIFPHHENEITQSECAHDGATLANYWVHNGMVLSDGKKMAKSEGNFITVDEALSRAHGEAIRLMVLNTHYRQPLDWSWVRLDDATNVMNKFYRALQETWDFEYFGRSPVPEYPAHILEALYDDMNTPEAIKVLHQMADNALNSRNAKELGRLKLNLIGAGKLLGLLQMTPDEWFHYGFDAEKVQEIDRMIALRNNHRANKEWADADAVRNKLTEMGITLEDQPFRTIWRKL